MTHPSTNTPNAVVVVPAGGMGRRMGGAVPKQFLQLGGVPMLVHTLKNLLACPLVTSVIPVVPERELIATERMLADHGIDQIIGPVAGGDSRQQSVLNGLLQLPDSATIVAVHDAARPFPNPSTLENAIRQAATEQLGVVIGRPSHDTIKQVDDTNSVTGTPDRTHLWQAFTPQVFPAKMIVAAYRQAATDGFIGTDDASLAEWAGATVRMLAGDRESLKVTTPQDLITARAWLAAEPTLQGATTPVEETR